MVTDKTIILVAVYAMWGLRNISNFLPYAGG